MNVTDIVARCEKLFEDLDFNAVKEWKAALLDLIPGLAAATAEIEKAEKAPEALTWVQEREKRILDELKARQDAFLSATPRLGIALESDVTAQIEKNNQVLELYERRLKRGEISAEDFARAQLAVAAANAELSGSLAPATREVESITGAYSAASGALDLAKDATDRFTLSTRANTQALREQEAQAVSSRNALGGESYFAQIGGGTFTYPGPTVTTDPDGRLVPG